MPARRDPRSLKFGAVLSSKLPEVPAKYEFDAAHSGVDSPMFGNDQHGDCVIAGRAHQTRRFELIETDKVLHIKEADVLREWYSENGYTENGLYVLDSLKLWRSVGWRVGKKRYKIDAFAAIDWRERRDVTAAIFLLSGIGCGFSLPFSVTEDTQNTETWEVLPGPEGATDPHGGHYVTLTGYDAHTLTCITWGRKQKMSWDFFETYCDEAYGIVDALDPWRKGKKTGLDVGKLEDYLHKLV